MNTIDGAPDAMKVACPVLAGGKAGDYFKGLPIRTCGIKSAKGAGSLCRAGIPARVQEHRAGIQITDTQLGKGTEQPL